MAEYRYSGNGVRADASACRPQGTLDSLANLKRHWYGTCHRWVGYDEDGADVAGSFRITGHSNGNYGYLPLYGGLRWL